ncbi:MAG TPA: amidohydrolase family protein [Chloroflexota bacterium]|nr:amidohydrolase family protein [Chloroflexota bacterium]
MAIPYKMISSDSHLEVPPEHWIHRVPQKYREIAPRRVRLETGSDALVVDGSEPIQNSSDMYASKRPRPYDPNVISYEDTAGTGPAEQRLQEQDVENIEAEVFFPAQVAGPASWRRIKDDDAYLAVVRAYNDWLIEEYCATAPNRLIGLGVLPWTSGEDIIAEMERCAKKGFKGVSLGVLPGGQGYPTPEDDRFWAAALDLQMPVAIHVELRRIGHRTAQPSFHYPREPERLKAALAPGSKRTVVDRMARFGLDSALTVSQLVMSHLFDRFPDLKVFVAESRVGWLPFWFENADLQYERNIFWCSRDLGLEPLKSVPSEYIKQHFYWSIQCERVGVEVRHHIGVDHLMFATDFPHVESEFPRTPQLIEEIYADVPEAERYNMLRGNAIRFFKLEHQAKEDEKLALAASSV